MVPVRHFFVVSATFLFASLLVFAFSQGEAGSEETSGFDVGYDPSGNPIVSGELVVIHRPDERGLAGLEASLPEVSGVGEVRVTEELPALDAKVLRFPELRATASLSADESLQRVKERLEEDPAVEEVYYNYIRSGFAAPNDPGFRKQYGMKKVKFPSTYGRYRSGVRVAVVDSGVHRSHSDLQGKVVAAYDFHNDNGTVEDLNGHGTFIAGIIAAKTNNRVGVASGCPRCTIVAAKALDKDLLGSTVDIARAINWSVDRGAKVVNLSLGSHAHKSVEQRAINRAANRGVVVTAAGGNYGTRQAVYPAAYGNAMAVSYTGPLDRTSSHSSYGGYIDVAAPGVDIFSTVPGGYATYSGSSFSAPHTAALAGVLMGQGRGREATIQRIQSTAADLGAPGRDERFGHGRIDAEKATRR